MCADGVFGAVEEVDKTVFDEGGGIEDIFFFPEEGAVGDGAEEGGGVGGVEDGVHGVLLDEGAQFPV